ncbi:Clavaminate synthase-like protein [Byssothecium circinans]|uniref:Clavaminate synthase-like protein n=1 Tax=Byssothecium circinans TaxID=147558 RepID=A0A6A5UC70_9PLEO|nr:Clavaminate synthase-like protein [Byssothecium circinans]
MTASFASLPIVDVGALQAPNCSAIDADYLSKQLYDVFLATGFAYFPTQSHLASDNLIEGFEIGNPRANRASSLKTQKVNLTESNVWPDKHDFGSREQLEQAYNELQALASQLLSLLAISLDDSLSTLRLLHYPPAQKQPTQRKPDSTQLSCTPHTDSGILTLLHQGTTGGLEVLNTSGEWVPVPYVPASIVVNIGDLMATVSGGRFTATMHRVRTPPRSSTSDHGLGRFSIPFFFEPGEACVVVPVDGDEAGVVYGEHLRKEMATWVKFQNDSGYDTGTTEEM